MDRNEFLKELGRRLISVTLSHFLENADSMNWGQFNDCKPAAKWVADNIRYAIYSEKE